MSSSLPHHRLIIVGSGPAGLTAGIYAGRAQLAPLILEGPQMGGQLMGTTLVENWPGTKSIAGAKLMLEMREQAQACGAVPIPETLVSVNFEASPLMLTTKQGKQYTTSALIIATGATPRRLGCPGETEYWGRGVSTCAVCDGALYRGQNVVVVGGGDTAMESASFLAKLGNRVTVVVRSTLSASAPMQRRVVDHPAISLVYHTVVTEILGTGAGGSPGRVTGVALRHQQSQEVSHLAADGVFIAAGLTPNTSPFQGQLPCAASGHLSVARGTMTTRPGVFAAGDVVDARYRQAITAAGDGCRAALDAEQYLSEHD